MDPTIPHEPTLFPQFEPDVWIPYGRKGSKMMALKEWAKLEHSDRVDAANGVAAYVASTPDKKFRLDMERYLKRKKWQDEPVTTAQEAGTVGPGSAVDQKMRDAFASLARQRGGAGTDPGAGH